MFQVISLFRGFDDRYGYEALESDLEDFLIIFL